MSYERRFVFRLAAHLGKTVAELERDLGPGELEEWEAYHYFEPFGPPVDDDRFALLANILWCANSKSEPPVFFNRDPEAKPEIDEEQEASDFFAFLDARTTKVVTQEDEPDA